MNTKTNQAPAVKADTDKIAAYLRWIMRTVNNFEAKTGKGGWFAEEMQDACNAIAKETGTPVKFGISSYSAGYEHPTGDNPFPSNAAPLAPEQIEATVKELWSAQGLWTPLSEGSALKFTRAIEAAHGIGSKPPVQSNEK